MKTDTNDGKVIDLMGDPREESMLASKVCTRESRDAMQARANTVLAYMGGCVSTCSCLLSIYILVLRAVAVALQFNL